MIGIVLVSHSHTLAEGAAELARQMGGEDVRLEAVGGLDLPDHPIGTDALLVQQAVERVWSEDGVLVLMDLGSAVLSAEMALDMLPEDRRDRVRLCDAPFIEGAVAAAVAARLDRSLDEVEAEARGGLEPKRAHLAPPGGEAPEGAPPHEGTQAGTSAAVSAPPGPAIAAELKVENRLGLHARPAARFVQTASAFDADVRVRNVTTGRGPASARSLNQVATLGVLRGHRIEVSATGPQARQAVDALRALAADGFGDRDEEEAPAAAAPEAPAPAERPIPSGTLAGLPASPGVAVGPARRFARPELPIPREPASDPGAEWRAFERAVEGVRAEIARVRGSVAARAGEQSAAIFDAHALFLQDEELLAPTRAAVLERGRNAAQAWSATVTTAAQAWRALEDPYQRARAADLEAVGRQVLARLLGTAPGPPTLTGPGILVAADLTPADTAGLEPAVVLGIATAFGGPTSHSAVLARSLGIPAVVGLGRGLLDLQEGTTVVLDGDAGTLTPDPSPAAIKDARARADRFRAAEAEALRSAAEPATTLDGTRIEVVANVGRPEDAIAAARMGAEGVGLLRTEFLFLDRDAMPTEQEQERAYREVAEAMGGRPVIVRTLDVGGDKPLPYLPIPREANPFLGVRGLRLGLARPEVLRAQLRALLRAGADHPIRVMFPMVSTPEEVRAARAELERAAAEVREAGGRTPEHLEVGIMVEVPSAALLSSAFAEEVDFFSIGTNDLTQYTLAAERGNERVGALADGLHPAVLRLIAATVEGAAPRGRTVGVCGELAADPAAVPVLVGLGVTELSASPPAIPRVKRAVRELRLATARELAARALELGSAAEVRDLASRG
ncbi:MAG: phosphoenolpyruvate--protein phosphotransferase [Candidatus Velamenicoccus archaeovorus]